MEKIDEFMAVYGVYAGSRPMHMSLKEIKTGILRWRLHIFEKGTAPNGGDMELLCVEKPTKAECLERGISILKERLRNEQEKEKEAV